MLGSTRLGGLVPAGNAAVLWGMGMPSQHLSQQPCSPRALLSGEGPLGRDRPRLGMAWMPAEVLLPPAWLEGRLCHGELPSRCRGLTGVLVGLAD